MIIVDLMQDFMLIFDLSLHLCPDFLRVLPSFFSSRTFQSLLQSVYFADKTECIIVLTLSIFIIYVVYFCLANAWEEGDEVVLITCRLENPDLDMVSGSVKEKLENFANEL